MVELWRISDHGNEYFMRSFDGADEVEQARDEYQTRGESLRVI